MDIMYAQILPCSPSYLGKGIIEQQYSAIKRNEFTSNRRINSSNTSPHHIHDFDVLVHRLIKVYVVHVSIVYKITHKKVETMPQKVSNIKRWHLYILFSGVVVDIATTYWRLEKETQPVDEIKIVASQSFLDFSNI